MGLLNTCKHFQCCKTGSGGCWMSLPCLTPHAPQTKDDIPVPCCRGEEGEGWSTYPGRAGSGSNRLWCRPGQQRPPGLSCTAGPFCFESKRKRPVLRRSWGKGGSQVRAGGSTQTTAKALWMAGGDKWFGSGGSRQGDIAEPERRWEPAAPLPSSPAIPGADKYPCKQD